MSRALPPVSNEVEALVVFVDFVHQKYWFLEFERCLEFKLNVFPGETSGAEEEQNYCPTVARSGDADHQGRGSESAGPAPEQDKKAGA